MTAPPRPDPFFDATPEIVAEALALFSACRYGALATLAPMDGWPQATRVGLAPVGRFRGLILVSALAAHTAALRADPRCSLLLGEAGKGDPLAHKRLTLKCRTREIFREDAEGYAAARAAYLSAQPKAKLYIDLGDFALMALAPESVSFNGGFGRAARIEGEMLAG